MTTRLIIARHGNTFEPHETPRRVGGRTNLPLVEKGREQAKALGLYLREHDLMPDIVYCSRLERTMQTAYLATKASGITMPPQAIEIFDEIDYGPDENQTDIQVIARIGEQAIKDWDEQAIVPDGWRVNPEEIITNWKNFTNTLTQNFKDKTILVVTSNGIARFAPHIAGNFETFAAEHKIKLSTGALSLLEHDGESWSIQNWNVKP